MSEAESWKEVLRLADELASLKALLAKTNSDRTYHKVAPIINSRYCGELRRLDQTIVNKLDELQSQLELMNAATYGGELHPRRILILLEDKKSRDHLRRALKRRSFVLPAPFV